mgnify:FL=1
MQELIGIKTFTKNGLATSKGELVFFQIAPTNISVLSHANIEVKIRHLLMVLSSVLEIEIVCTDSCECFDRNKIYLRDKLEGEKNPKVQRIMKRDIEFLDDIQMEMATARQFMMIVRCKALKPSEIFKRANEVEAVIAKENFEVHRMKKPEIKRLLALYFEASVNGEQIPDIIDGAQFLGTNNLS